MADNEKNILYLSYDGMTDPLGQSQVIPYLQGLSKEGYSFTLISFEKEERFKKNAAEISKLLEESNIDWVPFPYTKKPPILSTLWDLRKMRREAFLLHQKKNFKIIHCRSYISALVGLAMKNKLATKFIFDMRGFYADERVDGGIWKLSNPVFKAVYDFFKRREKEFLTQADYTVSLTQKAKDIIHTWNEVPNQPVPIQVIPCCADLNLFSRKNIDAALLQRLRQQFGLTGNEFVLSYLGSIGTWYMMDEMLDFFKALLKKKASAKFLFITAESAPGILAKAREKNIPEGAFIITSARHKEVPTYIALSNCSIFFIKPVFSKSASSPTKQGEIMGMGIPHICNGGVGDVDSIVTPLTGYVLNNINATETEKGVDFVLNTAFNPDVISAEAKRFYSLETGVSKYSYIYKNLLSHENKRGDN